MHYYWIKFRVFFFFTSSSPDLNLQQQKNGLTLAFWYKQLESENIYSVPPCQGVWWISAGVMAASIADSLLPHDSDSPPGFHIVPMLHVSSSFQWTNPLIWGSLGESMGLLFGYASSSTFHPYQLVNRSFELSSLLYLIECLGLEELEMGKLVEIGPNCGEACLRQCVSNVMASHQSIRRRRNSPRYYERPWAANGSSHDRSILKILKHGKLIW